MRLRASSAPALLAILATAATTIVVAPSEALASGADGNVRAISREGEPRPWLYVGKVDTSARSAVLPEARARAVLGAVAPYATALDLVHAGTQRFGDGDVVVKLEQTHRGLPVIGRGAAVRLNARGESVTTALKLESDLPASIAPALSAADAVRAAQPMTVLAIAASDAHLVILPTYEGPRLAYAVVPAVPTGIPTAPRVMIDAIDGRVLEARDMIVFLNQAKVYETNPIAGPLVTKTLEIAPDGSGHLQNPFVQSQNCVDNKTVKSLNVGIPVSIHICDLVQEATADANGDFLYEPNDEASDVNSRRDTFSEVSMYHHASKVYSFFRTLQGDPNAQVTADKPLRTISNLQTPHGLLAATPDLKAAADPNVALDPLQNAFFSPAGQGLGVVFEQLYGFSAGAMWFGQGPRRDYSYDGDVVYHEFTHAVVDDTIKLGAWHIDKYGAFDGPGAMNEGLADYFSAALSGDPKMGEYAAKDILASLSVIRDLDNTDTCPSTITGEVHFDSTLFSGGLWKARASLPSDDRAKFDAGLYKAMRASGGNGDVGYEDVVNLFLATLETDFPAGAAALKTEMTARGVLPGCTRVFDGSKPAAPPPASVFSPGAFTAPGTANFAGAKLAPGMIQVKLALAAGQKHVNVRFDVPPARSAPSLFGGGGTPFAPVVLAKFGGAIEWATKGTLASNAEVTVDPKSSGATTKTYTASFDVPDGASSVYVQVANKGSSDGSYATVTVTSDAIVPESDAGTTTPASGDDAGAAGSGATPSDSSDSGGCGCHVPGSGVTAPAGGAALALMGLVALVGRRRRK